MTSNTTSLFSDSAQPDSPSDADPNQVELGVKFVASQDGTITGIRYYKSTNDTGSHFAHLWNTSGKLLASAQFLNETASGWQSVKFANAVAITAGTTYVASFHSNGHYASSSNFFVNNYSNGPLSAPSSANAGGNGVYAYGGSGTFPNKSWQASNYWVDVLFEQAPDLVAPSTPQNLTGSPISQTEIDLAWNASTDDSGVTGYRIYRDDQLIASPSNTSYADSGLTAGTTYTYRVLAFDAAGNVSDSSTSVTVKTQSPTPPPSSNTSVWSLSDVPAVPTDSDPSPVELGVKFKSTVSGSVIGIRYYKGSNDNGTHVANLWSNNGDLLANASFQNETASGWQTVMFATPISISANTIYVASYHSNGHYADTPNYFTTEHSNGELTVPDSASSGGNGVYAYGSSSSFPNQTYNSTNYWVDVIFSTDSGSTQTEQPINGSCGGSQGGSFSSAPTSNLCLAGTASAVTGAGPWYWTCAGTNGGANSSCSAQPAAAQSNSGVEIPGPSQDLFNNNPYYTCVNNRYVAPASKGGSDSNSGTSPDKPWLTLQHANDALPSPAPGYCVNLEDGTYTIDYTVFLNKGGNVASKTGFTVYRAMNMLGAKLVATSAVYDILQTSAPYIIIEGLELNGGHFANSHHGIDSCLGGTTYNGLHHIFVMNSYIHDMGANGVANCWAEYYWMIHNRLDGNAYGSWNSGISAYEPIVIPGYTPTDYDKKWTPYHNVYVYNRFYNNFTSPAGSPHTDGNGLEYDDTRHEQNAPNVVYAPMALIMGNISWANGGAGIEVGPTSANADVFNNTVYKNYLDTYNTGTWRGDLACSFCFGVTFKNNLSIAVPGSGILSNNTPYLSGNPVSTNTWLANLGFGADSHMDSPDSLSSSSNLKNTDPYLVSPSGGNFALCTGTNMPFTGCKGPSPAIGQGLVVPYWPQQTPGKIDLGACPSGVVSCP